MYVIKYNSDAKSLFRDCKGNFNFPLSQEYIGVAGLAKRLGLNSVASELGEKARAKQKYYDFPVEEFKQFVD